MTISYLYVGVLEQGNMQEGRFKKDGDCKESKSHEISAIWH